MTSADVPVWIVKLQKNLTLKALIKISLHKPWHHTRRSSTHLEYLILEHCSQEMLQDQESRRRKRKVEVLVAMSSGLRSDLSSV